MAEPRSIKLSPRLYEIAKVVLNLGKATVTDVAKRLGRREQDLMRDLAELERRGLVKVSRRTYLWVELNEEGRKCLRRGLPEEVVLRELNKSGRMKIEDLRSLGLDEKEVEAALGILRRFGVVRIISGHLELSSADYTNLLEYIKNTRRELEKYTNPVILTELPSSLNEIRRRGLVSIGEYREIYAEATDLLLENFSRLEPGEVVTVITPEIISLESWNEIEFKPFDLSVEPPKAPTTRKHFFVEVLNYMRELMVSLGFEEVKGPHVELELWNFDVLFVPQYHPSRRPTDVYLVNKEGIGNSSEHNISELVKRVGKYHREYKGYTWDPSKALRLVLRTHCTSVSVRTIWEKGPGEYRVFTIDRVFRPDTPDPTHLMEFHQLDGIIVGRKVSFKDLLEFFREFARGLGLGEVRFRPAYFPFTEPSVEGYVKHPRLGWIEVLPGGMFRRQVLEPLGLYDHNVAAWGIGVDRVAMILLGIDDIRELYSNDIREVEKMPIPRVVLGAGGFG